MNCLLTILLGKGGAGAQKPIWLIEQMGGPVLQSKRLNEIRSF